MRTFKQFVEDAGSPPIYAAYDLNNYLRRSPQEIDWGMVMEKYSMIKSLIASWEKKMARLEASDPAKANAEGQRDWFDREETEAVQHVYEAIRRLQGASSKPYRQELWQSFTQDERSVNALIERINAWSEKASTAASWWRTNSADPRSMDTRSKVKYKVPMMGDDDPDRYNIHRSDYRTT